MTAADIARCLPRPRRREAVRALEEALDLVEDVRAVTTSRYTLRIAEPADLDFMYEVKREAMRAYVEATFGAWDEAEQRARFERGFTPHADRVVVVDGRDVGTLSVDWDGDPVFIAGVYLAADVRGRGLGRVLVTDVLARARTQGRTVTLRVLKTNPRARALYDRLGFEVSGTTPTHFEMAHRS